MLYNTSELSAMADAFDQLHVLGRLQSTYISLCGANLFLFLLRIFKLLDFQPRMGILTRTISRAMGDLMHFFLLLATVLVLYMLMGHIIFGPTIEVFSTLQYSLQVRCVGGLCIIWSAFVVFIRTFNQQFDHSVTSTVLIFWGHHIF